MRVRRIAFQRGVHLRLRGDAVLVERVRPVTQDLIQPLEADTFRAQPLIEVFGLHGNDAAVVRIAINIGLAIEWPRDVQPRGFEHKPLGALAATSNSPTRGQVKIPHVTAARCRDDYPAAARLATRSAASFSRQLLPSNFSRLPRCISRSRSGVTTTTSPRSVGQSSTGRFDVSTVEDFS